MHTMVSFDALEAEHPMKDGLSLEAMTERKLLNEQVRQVWRALATEERMLLEQKYIYATNLQGDIVAILDSTGTALVTYTYDAWGNPLTTTGAMASSLGVVNPLRYRGYVYDGETGLYYLQSRYYNPEIGRWLNADGVVASVGSVHGNNAFAYCFNNPTNMYDPNGLWPKWVEGAWNFISGMAEAALGVSSGVTTGWTGVGAAEATTLSLDGTGRAAQGVGQIVNDIADQQILSEDNPVRSGTENIGRAIAGNTGAAVAGIVYDMAVLAASIYAGAKLNHPSACFIQGTEVLTLEGSKAIENIEAGDLVWACDPDTDTITVKPVVRTFINESTELIHIFVDCEEIVTTPEHPFYSPVKGWTDACKLRAGDILVTVNGEYVVVEQVQHEIRERPITVYNFEVEDYHTYYVSPSNVLVHNTCKQPPYFSDNQNALIELAKEYKRKGVTTEDANILVDWAEELGINSHRPMKHENQFGYWSTRIHIKIKNIHIPVIK